MKNILVVSANTDHVISLTTLLQKKGYVVIPAGESHVALSFLRRSIPIDAVIVDRGMEGYWAVMAAARSRCPLSPPLIVMSERVAITDYLDALSAGAFDFFFWPIRASEFLRIIEVALRRDAGQALSGANGYTPVASGTHQDNLDSFL